MVDNNLLLSPTSILVNSQGGAYVHNLIAGRIVVLTGEKRLTPYLKAHSTEVAGLAPNQSGDERFYNNILTGSANLGAYDKTILPVWMDGNVYLNGAKPGKAESHPLVLPDFNPEIKLTEEPDGWYLEIRLDTAWSSLQSEKLITTGILGVAAVPDLPYEMPDGSAYRIDMDYSGGKRNTGNIFPGPFALPENGKIKLKVWPNL